MVPETVSVSVPVGPFVTDILENEVVSFPLGDTVTTT